MNSYSSRSMVMDAIGMNYGHANLYSIVDKKKNK